MKLIISASIILLVLFPALAQAQSISATNSTGQIKDTFYTNETVYVTSSGNILTNSSEVRIYIVKNSDSWINLTNLTDVSTGIKSATTNSSGSLLPTIVWGPPLKVGSYDIVVDIDRDGKYNASDFIDNSSTVGFQVVDVPIPSLTVSKGPNSPSDRKFNLSSAVDNIMMQLKLAAGGISGSTESVKLNSIGLTANGTGNEKTGISAVKMFVDMNNSGTIDSGDLLIGYSQFISDNGILILSVSSDSRLVMNTTSSYYLLIDYVMSANNYDGDTFQFQIVSANAAGDSSGTSASIIGLPITSAVATITGGKTPITLCSAYKNQTSCSSSCKWCSSDNTCKNTTESCPIVCTGDLKLAVEQLENNSLATVIGLSGCDNKILYLRENSCIGTLVKSCSVSGIGCSITFATPSLGNHTYYACLDKNENGNLELGEQTSAVLSATAPSLSTVTSNWLVWIIVIAVAVPIIVVIILLRRKPKEFVYEYKP